MSPPSPPGASTGSETPDDNEAEDSSENNGGRQPDFDEESVNNSPSVGISDYSSGLLTEDIPYAGIDEQPHADGIRGFVERTGDLFRHMTERILHGKQNIDSTEQYYHAHVPILLSSPSDPRTEVDPSGSFRAGYISQRDLETAIGRDEWTMCCATTFIYAVQAKYPGLSRDEIIEAAGRAANTPLTDGSGSCVSDNGYISSIYQYSQALSENLGLDEYVDTPGQYPSVEAAREAGVQMMKVELSGLSDGVPQEHHLLQLNGVEIDPVPGDGIESLWDKGSRKEESVMALEWYTLP
jgi:hypothetical protein